MTKTDPQIINLNKVQVVGYCHHCQQPILDCIPVWVVNADNFLCPYYGARRLVFCTKDCLERTTESVLTQIKRNRSRCKQQSEKTDTL